MADDVRFQSQAQSQSSGSVAENSNRGRVMLAWTFVLVPMFWGVTQTLIKSAVLFK
ncbi:MAG: hypothetical protein JJD97_09215 [Gemmatimonadaceae bacterium]|nr:hypothetical protein [Gemmatimonadaceae bacterium]